MFVSQDLVKGVKHLRFGFGNDCSYEMCYRGISPFAVVSATTEQASHRHRQLDRLNTAVPLFCWACSGRI